MNISPKNKILVIIYSLMSIQTLRMFWQLVSIEQKHIVTKEAIQGFLKKH